MARRSIKRHGFRSDFERDLSAALQLRGSKAEYESLKVVYQKEPSKYTPDLLLPNNIIIEAKGRFLASDRAKHLLIKKQHPQLDIRFVFYRSTERLSSKSNTTYAMWAEQHGFKWSNRTVPQEWLDEEPKDLPDVYRKAVKITKPRRKSRIKKQ